jgi:hypothetical protein
LTGQVMVPISFILRLESEIGRNDQGVFMRNNSSYRDKKRSTQANFPHRVTFRISDRHKDELENFADKEGLTRSVLVRHLVVRFLEDQRKLSPPPPGDNS